MCMYVCVCVCMWWADSLQIPDVPHHWHQKRMNVVKSLFCDGNGNTAVLIVMDQNGANLDEHTHTHTPNKTKGMKAKVFAKG